MMKNRRLANTVLGLCLAAGSIDGFTRIAMTSKNTASDVNVSAVTLAVAERPEDNGGPALSSI